MATTTVRVSLWPDRDIEVDEEEVPWLRTQGLLVEDKPAGRVGTAVVDTKTEAPKTRRTKEA